MRTIWAFLGAITLLCGPGVAKPLLTGTQAGFVLDCLAWDNSYRRLLDSCEQALDQPGTPVGQRLDLMGSLAWAYYYADKTEAAREVFRQILDLDASSHNGLSGLAWLAYDARNYAEASRLFRQAMLRSPNAGVLAGLGASGFYADEFDVDQAVSLIDTALAINPSYSWALRRKGWMLEDKGAFDEAEAVFRRAVAIEAEDAGALYGLAYVISKQNRWREALPFVNRALAQNPDYERALSRRSLIYFHLLQYKSALRDAERVVTLSPGWSDGYVRKARALAALGQWPEALDVMREADERLGYRSFIVYWRARLLMENDRNRDALIQIARNVNSPEADYFDYILQARIGLALKDRRVSRPAVDLALKARPNSAWAKYYEALVRIAEGEFAAAEADFDSAIEAGLPGSKLGEFLQALTANGRHVQAVIMLVRYRLKT